MKYNFVTVNFNTPELVDALIKSIYKNSGIPKKRINIIVFDNSDKRPYKSTDVTVLDNTKGQIIDFDKWLSQFPNKRNDTINNHGSDKHCYTIDWLIHNIPEGFLLLDSDVLIKRPVRQFFDDKYIYSGKIGKSKTWENAHLRVYPFICYLNSKLILKNNINYFDKDHTWSVNTQWYDTGAAFLKQCEEKHLKGKDIDMNKYIVHFGASYAKDLETQKKWLYENRFYYSIC